MGISQLLSVPLNPSCLLPRASSVPGELGYGMLPSTEPPGPAFLSPQLLNLCPGIPRLGFQGILPGGPLEAEG